VVAHRIVIARGCVDDDGFEGICVAGIDEVNPAVDVIEVGNLAFDGAAVGFPDVGLVVSASRSRT